MGPSGWYLDGVIQGTIYSGNATTASSELSASGGRGFLASLEAGYPVQVLPRQRLTLVPQAQIIWQHVSFDEVDDGVGEVAPGSSNGPTGRLGLLAESTFVADSGIVWKPYVRGNLWKGWGARTATAFDSSPHAAPTLDEATWLEFAGGATVRFDRSWSLYGQAGYQFAVAPGNVRRDGLTGSFGFRYTW